MKSRIPFLILSWFLASESYAALTLKESFEAAKLNMESIKRAEAVVNQSEEQKIRARAAVLPTISGVGSHTNIDAPEPTSGGATAFTLTRQYSAGIRLTQPIFRGGTLSAYDQAKDNILLAKFQKESTLLNLYQLVINAYYNLSIAQIDKKNVEELLKYSRERVKEIHERTRIGRSRKGELVEAETQYLKAESQYQESVISLQQAERNFEFYTNLKPVEIGPLGNLPKINESLEAYKLKVKSRPDIQATRQETTIAEKQISVSKGLHYPSVDLTTNYYFDRTGILASSEWDLGFSIVIPIYQGGGVAASVREAVQGKRIAQLRSAEALRTAERDISINYQNIIQLQEQLKVLSKAVAKAEEAYRLNRKDYQLGLVTNLDVLLSLNLFIETKRSYNSLLSIAHLNYKNLEASIGVLP